MPTSFEALAIVALAVVPGYLARSAWSRGKTFSRVDSDLGMVVRSVALSLVIQVVLAPATLWLFYDVRDHLGDYPGRITLWISFADVAVPLVGGYLFGKASNKAQRLGGADTCWAKRELRRLFAPEFPSTFDQVAVEALPDPSVLLVEFTDGARLAGSYARGATVTTSPQRQGLFLAQEWEIDGEGIPSVSRPGSAGIIVPGLEGVRAIHIFAPQAGNGGSEASPAQASG